ncbi:MAG TPA: hypothetical protein VF933_07310 [Streptosporangiaceae bacterium]
MDAAVMPATTPIRVSAVLPDRVGPLVRDGARGRLPEPVADQQLAERRQAHGAPGLGELDDFRGGGAVGVHHLQVRPEQAARGQRGDLPGRGRRPGGVHGDREAQLAGGRDLLLVDGRRHPHRGVAAAWAPAGHSECEQSAGTRAGLPVPVLRAQPAGVHDLVVGVPGRVAVGVPGPQPGFGQRAQLSLGVGGPADVVRPVVHRGDARVDGLGAGQQGALVVVLAGEGLPEPE